MPNGAVHYGCKDPAQATARLIIVLISRIQNSGTGDNNFLARDISVQLSLTENRTGQRGPTSKLVPNIPVGPNRNGPLRLTFPEFWVEWKTAYYFPLKLLFGLLKQTVPNPFPAPRHQRFL